VNKVRVLTLGPDAATRMEGLESTQTDPAGEPLSMMSYDIALVVEVVNERKVTTPIPMTNSNAPVDVPKEMLEDLEAVTMKLSREEIINLLKGVSLKDVFASRKTSVSVTEKATSEPSTDEAVEDKANELISKLFGDTD
jgi:hypothetical protein